MSKSDPSVNPNAKQETDQPAADAHEHANAHRSHESQIEGGQNQYEGEPAEGYGGRGQVQGSVGGRE